MADHWEEVQKKLDTIHEKQLFRETKVYQGIDFCSNDYMGLTSNPRMLEYFQSRKNIDPFGSTASRLVRGNRVSMDQFESEFARFVEGEAALLVSTGFTANFGLLDSIAAPDCFVFTDRLNHASILDGIRISGAQKKYYNHLDLNHLRSLLEKVESEDPGHKKKRIVVTETLFSMDGDSPDLKTLLGLKKEFGFVLVLDEAHALGIYGPSGKGLVFRDLSLSEIQSIDYRVYTLGKSLGLEGGIIVTKKIGRDHLVNVMRSFIFSTAPLPMISEFALFALSLIRSMDKERHTLLSLARELMNSLEQNGFVLTHSTSHIIPLLLTTEKEALFYANSLQGIGLDVRAIRPPTVSTPRLRISLNAKLKLNDIQVLIEELIRVREKWNSL
ncbi:8-amino-7-oxononanoate synthase [Leptospira sp. 2 VSF19]|uniref:8-amino-7-oxononanoate synthase n=1 Tax=Leptospira soteropolitanensis TaxID=2950025 RepID=A0AAW5VPA9_9LEPT|nr:8-amino-7-oxononanoate synthase [Leptospira soteropolitanensis]MCW7494395.1 8-amino-7-oxononanoate synthase [Leptospira soteropolitanensis]MCW7501896.1 8-amino-7-oxononanoate synthase [Leptospira soteropolitanensis]MCW7524241.1 8-amino-7-oxononanoate synthase [Leptospira soteropolitanensis]MCW7528106.1 8-amino-7-oxononanoate synthase [Leptospira soteropolitanensis]MCW7531960.1 8-amino-7-oxononanoate synthase [Leptospira soteropolitanensis]